MNNWLKQRLETCGLTTSHLSQILEDEYEIMISRQVLDNWTKMPPERIPISLSNPKLVCAFVTILKYRNLFHFLDELGYRFPDGIQMPDLIEQVKLELANYEEEQAEPIAILLEQIVDSWPEIRELTFKHSHEAQ